MSRIKIILLVAVGALVGALLVPTAATGAAAILKVVVTNTNDNPVPVRGSVNVSGPAVGGDPVPVSGSVTVADDREPFEVRVDISLSESEPFDTASFNVPEGKRLVVEFVSARVTVPNGQTPLVGANTLNAGTGFAIPVALQGVGNGNAFYAGAMKVTDFADAGSYVVNLERQLPAGGLPGGTASGYVYVSGYLMPAGS